MGILGWLTPDSLPETRQCVLLVVPPRGGDFYAMLKGALVPLFDSENYELEGTLTEEECALYWRQWDAQQRWLVPWNPYSVKLLRLHPTGLIAYWPLWEALAATRARDFGTNAYHGTAYGSTWETTGIGDGMTAIAIPASGARIGSFPAGLFTALNKDLGTISFWANTANWFATAFYYHFSAVTFVPSMQFNLRKDSPNTYTFYLQPPGITGTSVTASIAAWAASGWHNIAATWDVAGDAILYLDGAEAARAAHPGSFAGAAPTMLNIGSFADTFGSCNSTLAHVALWDHAKSAEEISEIATY